MFASWEIIRFRFNPSKGCNQWPKANTVDCLPWTRIACNLITVSNSVNTILLGTPFSTLSEITVVKATVTVLVPSLSSSSVLVVIVVVIISIGTLTPSFTTTSHQRNRRHDRHHYLKVYKSFISRKVCMTDLWKHRDMDHLLWKYWLAKGGASFQPPPPPPPPPLPCPLHPPPSLLRHPGGRHRSKMWASFPRKENCASPERAATHTAFTDSLKDTTQLWCCCCCTFLRICHGTRLGRHVLMFCFTQFQKV